MVYASSRAEALKAREVFARRYRPWYPKAVDVLEDDWERMVTFYDFPDDHWKHLRTTNVVESPFAALRLRTTAAKRFKRVERESVESWSEVLRDLKARGIEAPRLLMADGNAAIWGAVRQVWPEAGEQRCWNHKMRNVLDRLPQREQSEAKDLLRAVVYAPSRAEAVKAREVFARALQAVVSEGGGCTRGRLGADGGVLRFPRSPLETSANHERRRKPVCERTPQDERGEAIQAGRERYSPHLEAPDRGREALQEAQRSPPAQRRVRRKEARRREARLNSSAQGSRLRRLHTY